MWPVIVYLNNATTAYPREQVAVAAYNEALNTAPADVRHAAGDSDADVARARIAELLGVAAGEVALLSDGTLAINYVIQGTARGGRILADNRSHNAVLRTANAVGRLTVVDLYSLEDEPQEFLDPGFVPDLICLTHTSNVNGAVLGVEQALAGFRERFPGCPILVDASQAAGAADMGGALAADYVVFPGHKHLGAVPGAAVLVARRALRPLVFGGTGAGAEDAVWSGDGNVVEVGTPNAPAALALAAALARAQEEQEADRKRIAELVALLHAGLAEMRSLRPIGPPPDGARTGVVGCAVTVGHPELDWARTLGLQGVIVRGGLMCSPVHHGQLGLPLGTLRFSVSRHNSAEQVERAVAVVAELDRALTDLYT
ncbi:aminotransferase class V-fold PLP-dependent enzyme [Nonomuraea sp. NPDC050691]|uniref:aminotransferase class V-fold PLP-dependent enzyme n=1 Tax=Nonomuraea sp. NPDC050691 TaxID=3155661 RepID=UPI0033CFD466